MKKTAPRRGHGRREVDAHQLVTSLLEQRPVVGRTAGQIQDGSGRVGQDAIEESLEGAAQGRATLEQPRVKAVMKPTAQPIPRGPPGSDELIIVMSLKINVRHGGEILASLGKDTYLLVYSMFMIPGVYRVFSEAALLLALLGGCSDQLRLLAVVGYIDPSCPHPEHPPVVPFTFGSIRVEVIEWYSGEAGTVRSSECIDHLSGLAAYSPLDLMDYFDERGYVAQGIPTDVPTRVQIIGFLNDDCVLSINPVGPAVCGLTIETLSETGYGHGDELRFTFSCASSLEHPLEPRGLFENCLSAGSHHADNR